MREDDGRKFDYRALEQLRIRAVGQVEQAPISTRLPRRWDDPRRRCMPGWPSYREDGLEALEARPVPGRPPRLSGAQLARLYGLVVGNDPRQLRFALALWTRAMVRELIGREFSGRLSEVSVGRLLRKFSLSPQRPLHRANLQNPEAVARWKAEQYPAIREQAAEAGATIYYTDEAGMRSDYHAGTIWAPVGRTPVDGHPVHRSNAAKAFAASTGGRLRLCFLPGY
jgi:transposase